MEPALALLFLHHTQPVAQVVRVIVQKTLFLDKIDKHQSVKHKGSIPLFVAHIGDAFDKCQKGSMLFFEPFIKFLGYLFDIKGGPGSACNLNQAD